MLGDGAGMATLETGKSVRAIITAGAGGDSRCCKDGDAVNFRAVVAPDRDEVEFELWYCAWWRTRKCWGKSKVEGRNNGDGW